MNQELLRIVENIARDKNIDKESIFVDLEEAMISAARKHFADPDSNIVVNIDRSTGEITWSSCSAGRTAWASSFTSISNCST